MAKPRQPIDYEREDLSKSYIEDAPTREAGSLELDEEDLEDEDDMDY